MFFQNQRIYLRCDKYENNMLCSSRLLFVCVCLLNIVYHIGIHLSSVWTLDFIGYFRSRTKDAIINLSVTIKGVKGMEALVAEMQVLNVIPAGKRNNSVY